MTTISIKDVTRTIFANMSIFEQSNHAVQHYHHPSVVGSPIIPVFHGGY
jgi:hypothetical protein